LAWLEINTDHIDNAAINFLVKTPDDNDFNSWMLLPPNAKYWFNQQPFGNIKMNPMMK